MPELTITADEVAATSRLVADTSRYLNDGLSTLGREIDDLSTTWRGQASDAYASAWAEVSAGAHDVIAALDSMADSLDIVARGTAATEAATTHSISSLHGIA
ncbi:WXG100 family type VII secretion target [Actinomycetes bacterium M1A6_2h]